MRTGDTRHRSTKKNFAYMHKHTNRYIWGTTQTVWQHYRLKETATVVEYWISCLDIHTNTCSLSGYKTEMMWPSARRAERNPVSHMMAAPLWTCPIQPQHHTGYLLHIFIYWANLNSRPSRPVIDMQKRVNKQGCWNWLLAERNHDFFPPSDLTK